MRATSAVMLSGLTLVATSPAGAGEITVEQIVKKTLEKNSFGFNNAIARMTLTMTSKRGTRRVREIEIRSVQKNHLGKSLVRFHAPADVAGTGFLVIENKQGDDDQYLYLPALGKVKRISGSQRNQRFMGTDLTYADLESRNLRHSKSTRLADAKVGSNDVYTIESVPTDPKESQYGKTISWIHKKSFVPLRVEFYDKKLGLLKTLKVARLEKKSGTWVVMDSTIKNVQSKTQTQMTINTLQTDVKLGDRDFTKRALQQG